MTENIFIKEAEKETLLEVKRYGYTLEFLISPDRMDCHCSYEPSGVGTSLTETELQEFLTQFKISQGLVSEAVALLLESAGKGDAVSGLLLARGECMVPGADGYIALAVSDDLAAEDADKDENGAINLRHVQAFMNVEAGDLVATIEPPGPGIAGITVFGKVIAPQAGEPVKLQLGQNVSVRDGGKAIYAEAIGRVYCRGHEVSVEDLYVVGGDVDFKVGNIAFKGFVEIKGDVLDGFSVKATRGIKIHGVIGVCTVESDGDIAFAGMNGQGKGKIRCGGVLSANFINESLIECSGDIHAEIEIRNCHIQCLGAVLVKKGGLAGGECIALAGIETSSLGNVSSLRTRVIVGVHYHDLQELNRLFNDLKQLIAQFNSAPRGEISPQEFSENRVSITNQIQEVRSRTYKECNPKINVRKMLYEGVNVTLGVLSDNIREERKGPFSMIENTIEGGFRFLGMTDLSFKAQDIEKTFAQNKALLDQQKSKSE